METLSLYFSSSFQNRIPERNIVRSSFSFFSIFLTFQFFCKVSSLNLDSRLEMVTEYSQDPYRDMSVPKFMKCVNAPLFWE